MESQRSVQDSAKQQEKPETTTISLALHSGLQVLEGLVLPAIVLPLPNDPSPVSWQNLGAVLPSGFDVYELPSNVSAISIAPGAPTITEYMRSGGMDESLAIVGDSFSAYQLGTSAFGKDTRFVSYGQLDDREGGREMDAGILRLEGVRAAVTLPMDKLAGEETSTFAISDEAMRLLWPVNAMGAGMPVAVNQTNATWAQSHGSPGKQISIYGTNMADNHQSTIGVGWVWIEDEAATAGEWISADFANPYTLTITLPSGLDNGKYRLYAHNTHGGKYGFSAPVEITVRDELYFDSYVRSVEDYGAYGGDSIDDTEALQIAIDDMKLNPHSTLYFPAGTYLISTTLNIGGVNDSHFIGEVDSRSGENLATITTMDGFEPNQSSGAFVNSMLVGYPGNVRFKMESLIIDAGQNYNGNLYALWIRGYGGSDDLILHHVEIVTISPHEIANDWVTGNDYAYSKYLYEPFDFHGRERITISDSTFKMSHGGFFGNSKQISIDNSEFYGFNSNPEIIRFWGSEAVSITNSLAKDGGSEINEHALGRFIVAQDHRAPIAIGTSAVM